MPNGKVEKAKLVEGETLLAVPIELTPASKVAFKAAAPSIAGQKVNLKKSCITLLRAFLQIHRPDLINPIEDDSSEAEGEEGSADEAEQ
eukprot:3593896-Prymnesium_polylepis.1